MGQYQHFITFSLHTKCWYWFNTSTLWFDFSYLCDFTIFFTVFCTFWQSWKIKPQKNDFKVLKTGFHFETNFEGNKAILGWFYFSGMSILWVGSANMGFPNHSCQKSLSKSLGFASWLGKTFLAFVIWKNPY